MSPSRPWIRKAAAALLAGVLAVAGIAAPAQTKTLRFVPQADLKIIDPLFTTNYVARNFGYMVYDTLFAYNAAGVVKPQMVDKYTHSPDGKSWTFTLRPGLAFHDGSPVTAADCVASLQRWGARDAHGRALASAGAQWTAVDDKTFALKLNEPFGPLLEALAKVTAYPAFILPARLAKLPDTAPLNEAVGSGPFIFKRDEWAPGSKVVFVRNPKYVGRSEAPSFLAGNKTAQADRVEWVILPDTNSAVAALKNGEVDMIEMVPPDFINPLRADPHVRVGNAGAFQATLILNNLHPPFDNPKVRQAVLAALDQERVVAGMGYPLDMRLKHCATMFVCGVAGETDAGSQNFRIPDVAKGRQMLAAAGYKGEKVVVLLPTDYASLNAGALVAIKTLKDIGLNVETASMDWATLVVRRAKKEAPAAGGWSAYLTQGGESVLDSPLNHFMLGAACGNTMPGWPCDKKLDALRLQWARETVPAKRQQVLEAFQREAFESVPYVPAGQFFGAFAARRELRNVDLLAKDVPLFWVLGK